MSEQDVRAAMDASQRGWDSYQGQAQGTPAPDPRDEDAKSLPPPPDAYLATVSDRVADQR